MKATALISAGLSLAASPSLPPVSGSRAPPAATEPHRPQHGAIGGGGGGGIRRQPGPWSRPGGPPSGQLKTSQGQLIPCGNYPGFFNQTDATELQRDLNSTENGLSTPMPAMGVVWYWLGGAKVCVYNNNNNATSIKRWEVAWGLGYINDLCCAAAKPVGGVTPTTDLCAGGNCTAKGEQGAELTFALMNGDNACVPGTT